MPPKTRRNPPPRGFVAALRDRAERIVATYPRAANAAIAAAVFSHHLRLMGYYYVTFSHLIDVRLHGSDRAPRVFARPRDSAGDNVSKRARSAERSRYAQLRGVVNPGEFAVDGDLVSVAPPARTHWQDSDCQLSTRRSSPARRTLRRR